jgi:hypothetical protein
MNKATKIFLANLTVITTLGLLLYAIKGFTTRYAQDDYCLGYRLKENGLFLNQWRSYTQNTEGNGNRYSLTFSSNIIELLGGPDFVPFVPMLTIFLLASATSLSVMYVLNDISKRKLTLLSICVGVIATFFAIYLSPKQYQVFFWVSGLLTYMAPTVMYTIIAAFFLHLLTLEKITIIHMIVIGILTFFAGGFSETSTVWFFVLAGLINARIWFLEGTKPISSRGRILLLIIFLTTLLSMVVLAVSPYNYLTSRSHMSSISFAFRFSFVYAVDFVIHTIKSAPIPYAVLIGFGYLLAHLIKPLQDIDNKSIFRNFIITSVSFYLLVASSMFPSLYVMSAYPDPRALTPAHVSLLGFLIIIGYLLERFQHNILPFIKNNASTAFSISMILLIALTVYIGRAIFLESQKISDHQKRAQMWDFRQEMILDAQNSGIQDVVIPAFDSIFSITELKDDPWSWVNLCAARYYGVNSITAIENYNDIGTYPLGK